MADRIFTADERPFDTIPFVAIAIGAVTADQRHIGVLHRDAGPTRLLHLAWHNALKESAPKRSYIWIELPIAAARGRQIAATCRLVSRTNQGGGIPYGFSPPTDCFDEKTGQFLIGPTRHGLTCATFVIALFERAGLPLILLNEWPKSRPGDEAWQEWVLQQLQQGGAPREHIEHVRAEKGAARYRPEEVAAAGAADHLPAGYAVAAEGAKVVLQKLMALGLFVGS